MRKPATLLLVVLAVLVPACDSSDTGEQIEGVWKDTTTPVYLVYDENGQ